jgi:hypothetical protein
MKADWAARVAALRQRWETSLDREALLGALIFYQLQLPEWLFRVLWRPLKSLHATPMRHVF